MAVSYKKIAYLEEKVTQSAENFGLLSDLIKISEISKVIQTKKSIYSIICQVLGKYIELSQIKRENFLLLFHAYYTENQTQITSLLKNPEYLICEKFVIFTLFLLENITENEKCDSNKILVIFKALFGIAKVLNLQIIDENENKYDKYYLALILNKFIMLKSYSPLLIELITDNYLFGFPDLVIFSIDYLTEILKSKLSNNAVFRNILGIVTNFEMSIEEIFNSGYYFENPQNLTDQEKFSQLFKKKCEALWFEILKFDPILSLDQKQLILSKLMDRVFPYIFHPLMFADFILSLINLPENTSKYVETQIYGLSCILNLSQTSNYEYLPFYTKLYKLLDTDNMGNSPFDLDEKAALQYIKLLELALKNTSVSHGLVSGFIKKLARLSIKSSLKTTIVSLGIILNLIKKHPKTLEMIHKNNADSGIDNYDEKMLEPTDSKASKSSLWELTFLKFHYSPIVRELVKMFETKFVNEESMNMIDLAKINYLITAKKEEFRKISKLDANIDKLYQQNSAEGIKKRKICDSLIESFE